MQPIKQPTLSDLQAMEIDRRWIRRHAIERFKNNNRIIQQNYLREKWNQDHPNQPPLAMFNFTEHLCRQHGYDKAAERLRNLQQPTADNVIQFQRSAQA